MDLFLQQCLGLYNNLYNYLKFKRYCYFEDIYFYNNFIVNGFWERFIGLIRENLNKVFRKVLVYFDIFIFLLEKQR